MGNVLIDTAKRLHADSGVATEVSRKMFDDLEQLLDANGIRGEVLPIKPRITPTPSQAAVLDTLAAFARGEYDNRLAVLTGFAGTGKTTLVTELIRRLRGDNGEFVPDGGLLGPIAVCAPTHKALGAEQA